jgi:hypothetical protein
MMRASLAATAFVLVVACSSPERGGPATQSARGLGKSDGVDPPGSGADIGGGADNGATSGSRGGPTLVPCERIQDCAGGVCLSTGALGVCTAVCAASPNTNLPDGIVVQRCSSGEVCAGVDPGVSVCLLACTTADECPAVPGIDWTCAPFPQGQATWCIPSSPPTQ